MSNNSQHYEKIINDLIIKINDLNDSNDWNEQYFDQKINELQNLVQEYYVTLYPKYYGWFFVPLTPTIGCTHCHYLNMDKFTLNKKNHYRIQCNFLNFEILDLPEAIQPTSITEMIHTTHLISYLKNIYHDLHIAPIHFSNREKWIKGWKFILTDKTQRLIYDWESSNIKDLYDNWVKKSDILISDRSLFPNLSQDPEKFLFYLNTWNNKALLELIRSRELLPALVKRLEKNPTKISVWEDYEILENEYSNIHFINWILWVHEKQQLPRSHSISTYQKYINAYTQQNDYFDKVFFVWNWTLNQDPAFSYYNHDFYKILQRRYGNSCFFFVPNPMWLYDQAITSPDSILNQLESQLSHNPNQKVLFTLWLHGKKDWSASYIWGSFYKSHFETLFELAASYQNLQIIIISCRSNMKTESLIWNVIMSSSRQVSYASYSKYFIQELYAGKTIYQAHVASMINYHDSLLPTSFYDTQWVSRAICPLLKNLISPQNQSQKQTR